MIFSQSVVSLTDESFLNTKRKRFLDIRQKLMVGRRVYNICYNLTVYIQFFPIQSSIRLHVHLDLGGLVQPHSSEFSFEVEQEPQVPEVEEPMEQSLLLVQLA
jgi:hypothetical protein